MYIFLGMKPEDRIEHHIIKDDPYRKFNVQAMHRMAQHELRDELTTELDKKITEREDEILEKEMENLINKYRGGDFRR